MGEASPEDQRRAERVIAALGFWGAQLSEQERARAIEAGLPSVSELLADYPKMSALYPTADSADLLDPIEVLRTAQYPEHSRAEMDAVQAEQLFDNDGEPIWGFATQEGL